MLIETHRLESIFKKSVFLLLENNGNRVGWFSFELSSKDFLLPNKAKIELSNEIPF